MSLISKELSGEDVIQLGERPPRQRGFHRAAINILPYENLDSVSSIDQILSADGCCVLLYQEDATSGHWVAIFKRTPKTISFFDSYGEMPDRQQNFMTDSVRKRFYKSPHIARLLASSPYRIHYNDNQFQSDGSDVATCGRHCVVRLWKRGLSSSKYRDFIHRQCKKHDVTPDELVTYLTSS